jgi:hypothetical protein
MASAEITAVELDGAAPSPTVPIAVVPITVSMPVMVTVVMVPMVFTVGGAGEGENAQPGGQAQYDSSHRMPLQ